MLPPQAQDYALAFIARRLAIQVPSSTLTSTRDSHSSPAPSPPDSTATAPAADFFSSSLAQYIPFLQQLSDKTFPLQHVSIRTLVEVLILQLRAMASAIETIDESDTVLDMDKEAEHAAQGLGMIHVSSEM